MHGRLDLPGVRRIYGYYGEQLLVSVSQDQATWLPGARWVGTVHNGIDIGNYQLRTRSGNYLVFLGRISPEKRPDRVIEIARDVGMPLVIAAKVGAADQDYYQAVIAPLIARNASLVEFVGEVDEQGKDELLGGAYAYLFPIDWPEVVGHGRTGFVCDTFAEMIEAVGRVGSIDRRACRAHVEAHFCAQAMVDGYEQVYDRVLAAAEQAPARPPPARPGPAP